MAMVRCGYYGWVVREMHIAGFRDGGREPQAMECELPPEAGKSKEMSSPLEPPERNSALPPP